MGQRKRRRKKRRHFGLVFLSLLILAAGACTAAYCKSGRVQSEAAEVRFIAAQKKIAKENDLPLSAWPEDFAGRAGANPELVDFLLHYPLQKEEVPEIDLSEYENTDTVPLLMQWDERWGYEEYADNLMGFSGCGPTCLSMVCIYLKGDVSYNPRMVAQFAKENGYAVPGSGSAWTLISQGGETLGLDVTEIPPDYKRIMDNLNVGNPIICIMGPGDFTSTGHFIVLTGCEDGLLKVNDPNSRARSEKLWDFEKIKGQIRNLWVCR